MITGIGTDIVEIARFVRLIENAHFMERVFTAAEREYIQNRPNRAAGMFGAKEAFSKAVGTGLSGFSLNEVEICHDAAGKPYFVLHGRAQARYGDTVFHLSISHSESHAVAFAVASKE